MEEIILEITTHGAYVAINYFIMRASKVPGSVLRPGDKTHQHLPLNNRKVDPETMQGQAQSLSLGAPSHKKKKTRANSIVGKGFLIECLTFTL